jgi:NhaA family Na+:H+ antiporter
MRALAERLRARLSDEVAAAALLLLATALALVWVNAPFGDTYSAFWETELDVRVGGLDFGLSLQHWVNDGLMTFFFLVVGFEVKHELVLGELADPRRAAVPAVAALVGLTVPALVYVAFNLSTGQSGAWGTVISTDTAFVIGMLALLGRIVPPQLRVFLLAVAIGDDVGALTVIALFYTEDLDLLALAIAAVGVVVMVGLRKLRVWQGPAYLAVGAVSWVALHLSGVHPTLLGVAVALITPVYLPRRGEVEGAVRDAQLYAQSPDAGRARRARLSIGRSTPPGPRQIELWQPWVNFIFVPLFALANAGVPLTSETLGGALTSRVTLGIVAGLVLGKAIGISAGTWLALALRLGRLAPGIGRLHVIGGAALSGVGFTISLFIVDLAFTDDQLAQQARVGVLTASVIAGILGCTILRLAAHRRPVDTGPPMMDPPVDVERDHILGPVDAPLTLVGYGDFQAPFRGWGAVEELRDRLGDRFRYVYRHTPRPSEHPQALLAAEAAEVAAAQGRFWEMHDRLYTHQDELDATSLIDHAAAIGLDVHAFTRDLGAGRFARHVRHDAESAEASGVTAHPAFFVQGRLYSGPTDADSLASALLGPSTGSLSKDGSGTGPQTSAPQPPGGVSASPSASSALWDTSGLLESLPEDLPEAPDSGGDQPRLTSDQIAQLGEFGRRHEVARGEFLYRPGDSSYDFHVVLEGAVAVVSSPEARSSPTRVHGPGRFLGHLDLFDDVPTDLAAVVTRDGEVLRLTVPQLGEAIRAHPPLGDIIQRAFLARHAISLERRADVRIYGRAHTRHIRHLRERVESNDLSSAFIEIGGGRPLPPQLTMLRLSEADLPVVVLTQLGVVLNDPDAAELERALQAA